MNRYYKLCLATLVAVYFLIGVGSIVRTTGSGMGCPDWPKCFGQWVPPTSVDELPNNYKEIYSNHRDKKNQKFISFLKTIKMTRTAEELMADESILKEADFNPTKTLIEYVNRVFGAATGLMILLLFGFSIPFIKDNRPVFIGSFALLIVVLIQGWFGSIVVSTNLTTWTISVHMLLALGMVSILTFLLVRCTASNQHITLSPYTMVILISCISILLIQIILGVQVREAIDKISSIPRSNWISNLGSDFIFHRSFSWLVLFFHIVLFFKFKGISKYKIIVQLLLVLIGGSLLTGVGMAYFDVPPYLQPLHLLIPSISFGLLQYLFFSIKINQVASSR